MTAKNSKRILILDDDVKMRATLDLWLSDEGHHVTQAASGLEAISLHRQKPFDLVIIELILGDYDGFETFAELRLAASSPRFIATSKSTRMPAELQLKMARHLGAQGTIAKPFTAEQLIDVVRNVVGK